MVYDPYNDILNVIIKADKHGILQSDIVSQVDITRNAVGRWIKKLKKDEEIVVHLVQIGTNYSNMCYAKDFAPKSLLKPKRSIGCGVILDLIHATGTVGILQSELANKSSFSIGNVNSYILQLKKEGLIVTYLLRRGKANCNICFYTEFAPKDKKSIICGILLGFIQAAGKDGILQSDLVIKSGFVKRTMNKYIKKLEKDNLVVVHTSQIEGVKSDTYYVKKITSKE